MTLDPGGSLIIFSSSNIGWKKIELIQVHCRFLTDLQNDRFCWKLLMWSRECFGYWVLVPIWLFLVQFCFRETVQTAEYKKLVHFSEPSFNFNFTFLYQIKSNIWMVKIIEFLNFTLLNFVKLRCRLKPLHQF